MKAVLCTRYGPPEVLEVAEVDVPRPSANEILVKVKASTVTSGDSRIRALRVPAGFRMLMRLFMGYSKPRNPILGMELAGEVQAVGDKILGFKSGDQVFGVIPSGAHAEYTLIKYNQPLLPKPEALQFAEAAAVPFGALTSLVYLRDFGKIAVGHKVLINGASGALGVYAVQLARHFGAHVTAVCSSRNTDLVRKLGADRVIDYTCEDFATQTDQYDIIFDTVGNYTFKECKSVLTKEGRFLMAVANIPQYFDMALNPFRRGKKMLAGVANFRKQDLVLISQLLQEGKLQPVIDRSFSLEEIREAHRLVDKGHKRGAVVISI